MDVVDLLSGSQCFVHEVMGTETLAARDAILARVVAGQVAVISGVHESPLGPSQADDIITNLREAKVTLDEPAAIVRMIALWHEQIAEAARKAATPMRITNTDGHEVATIEDHFQLARGRFAAAFEKLAALDGTVVEQHDRKGAKLTFTRPGNTVHVGWKNTIIGCARLTLTRLILSTNSVERAGALLERVRDALGGFATWKKRTREEMPVRLGGETFTMDGQVTDSPSVNDLFREWLDTPIATLAGRAPRDAVNDEPGRHRLHVLLKEMERRHARNPIEEFDPIQLRRDLGLDELGVRLPNLELERAIGQGRSSPRPFWSSRDR